MVIPASLENRTRSLLILIVMLTIWLHVSSCSNDPTSPQTGSISGRAALEDLSDHSGIAIQLVGTGQSVSTGSSGQFTLSSVAVGTYTLRAAKEGYGSVIREGVTVSSGQTTTLSEIELLAEWLISENIASDTVWDAQRHLIIAADVTVADGAILTIQDGVQVRFQDGTSLNVEGTLRAVASDSANGILFTADDDSPSSGSWNRINFKDLGPGNDSRLVFCTIEYATTGIICNSASPTISHCRIASCYYAGILCSNSAPLVENSSIAGCPYGIRCEAGSDDAVITGNRLENNEQFGVACFESSPQIHNNLIQGSAYGIWCEYHSYADIEHNEITGNETGIYIYTVSAPDITKNSIHHNTDAILANNGSYPVANNNNLADNSRWSFHLNNSSTYAEQDVDARYNWWGTVQISVIEQQIRDKNDVNPGLPIGYVVYDPVLSAPDPTAGRLQ